MFPESSTWTSCSGSICWFSRSFFKLGLLGEGLLSGLPQALIMHRLSSSKSFFSCISYYSTISTPRQFMLMVLVMFSVLMFSSAPTEVISVLLCPLVVLLSVRDVS